MTMDATSIKRSSYDAGFDSPPRETRRSSAVLDGRPPPPRISKARACECLVPGRGLLGAVDRPFTGHAGAECKRHKIRCEIKPGESSCAKCNRSGIKCVVNDFSQKFVDDDGV